MSLWRRMPGWVWFLAGAVGTLIVAGLVIIAVVLVAGGESRNDAATEEPAAPKVFTVAGKMTLIDSNVHNDGGGGCWGTGGYSDMVAGAQVVVRDGKGNSVAVGRLQDGQLDGNSVTCVFRFVVGDVPTGSAVYSVEISHRGQISFTQAQASAIDLTLGT